MANDTTTARKIPSTATIILAAAGLIAAASAGVAVYRSSSGGSAVAAGPHGSVTPGEPVAPIEQKIAELETKLKAQPNDPQGWRMLGWSYFETGDLMKAATAYRKATEVEPGNAENWSSLGEALQSASKTVSTEAETSFRKAIAIDAKDPRARYFLAVQRDLKGDHKGAVDDWLALLKDTPPGAIWEGDLRRTIMQTAEKNKIDITGRMPASTTPMGGSVATAGIPGPTQEQLAQASSLPPSQQDEMVKGMVEGLAARLAQNPKDADGWIRLMRSRMVLNQPDQARAAMRSGLAAFKDDSVRQGQIRQAAQQLGVPSEG